MGSRGRARSGGTRLWLIALVAIGLSLLCATRAHAGSYTVVTCEAAPDGHSNHSWSQGASAFGYYNAAGCPNDATGQRQGLLSMAGLNVALGNLPSGSGAWSRFDAPAGTSIANVRLSYEGESRYPNGGWASFIASSDDGFQGRLAVDNPHFDFLDGCTAYAFCSYYGGNSNGYWGSGSSHYWDLPNGTTSVNATVDCESGSGCPTGSNGAYVTIHGAAVTLRDDASPTMSNGRGLWGDSNWARGVRYVGFDASDVSGVKTAAIELDPGTSRGLSAADETRPCDYTYSVPCPRQGIAADFDTARLSDGPHTLRFVTMDAAGNWNTADTTVYTDNGAPGRPTISLEGDDGWRMTPSFTIDWKNDTATGGSGIATAHWRICPADGSSDCWTTSTHVANDNFGADNSETGDFGITQPGDYTAQMYLEDAAGNKDPSTASDPIHLKFDNVPPGNAQPAHANGWINAEEARDYLEWVTLVKPTGGADVPVSGIAGFAVTTDGSDPGTTVNYPGDAHGVAIPMDSLHEGHNLVKARAISGAGLASPDVLSADLPVDLTSPTVTVDGAPDPATWSTEDVTLIIRGSDQVGLSGMDGAPLDQPIEQGAYVTYSIDGNDPAIIRGDSAQPTLSNDGHHVVRYQAYDAAGNPSAQGTVNVNIDKGSPRVIFNAVDPAHLNRLVATAFDETSTIADGQILIRKVDPSTAKALAQGAKGCRSMRAAGKRRGRRCVGRSARTRQRSKGRHRRHLKPMRSHAGRFNRDALAAGQWVPLGTYRDGDTFSTDVDTSTLGPGTYQFEAVVHDAAGNEGIGTTYEDGSTAPIIVVPAPTKGPPGSNGSNGTNGSSLQASVSSSQSSVHCFGCGSYPTATITTKLTAALVDPGTRKVSVTKKCVKRGHRRTKCRRTRRGGQATTPERLVGSRVVSFGQKAAAQGKLTLGDGTPLSSQRVDVYEKLDNAGATYREIASVTTDAHGAFGYNAPAGPSRSIGFRYDGDHDRRASQAAVSVRVPAVTTIKVSRRSARNGQSVTFTGTVLGKPLPRKGKVIDLQAFYRGKWRSFATPRANGRGQWKYSYRFGATHGLVTYRFRAHVIAEAAYPYDVGYSKTTSVRVSGR
jgi:hypothetical protein